MKKQTSNRTNRQIKESLTPQGLTKDNATDQPLSQLEEKAKKDNTKS